MADEEGLDGQNVVDVLRNPQKYAAPDVPPRPDGAGARVVELLKNPDPQLAMIRAKQDVADAQQKPGDFLAQNMIPFGSTAADVNWDQKYKAAKARFEQGQASYDDINHIAGYERLKEIERTEPTERKVLRGLARIPAIVGESLVGGELVKPITGLTSASRAGRIGLAVGKNAATTAAMPSMYLPGASHRSVEQGGSVLAPENIGPAFAMGMAQTAVLGSLQNVAGGVPTVAGRIGAKTAIGMGEQAGVDVAAGVADEMLPERWKLKTRYGLLGSLARGESGPLTQRAITEAATFAVFSAMHAEGRHTDAIMPAAAKYMDSAASAGLPSEAAAREMAQVNRMVSDAHRRNLTRADAEKLFERYPDGPLRDYAEKAAATLPEKPGPAEQASPAGPEKPVAESNTKPEAPAEGWGGYKSLPLAKQPTVEEIQAARQPQEGPQQPQGGPIAPTPPTAPETAPPAAPAEPATPPAWERYYRVPKSKTEGSNVDAAITELAGVEFAGKFASRGAEAAEPYHTPGKVQFEFAGEKFRGEEHGDYIQHTGKTEATLGGKAPMYMHPALAAIRYKGEASAPEFGRLNDLITDANKSRAAAGLEPIKLTATAERKVAEPVKTAEPPAPEKAPEADAGKLNPTTLFERLQANEPVPGISPVQRSDLYQHHVEGKTLEEIGAARGVVRETVRISIERALEKLHGIVDEPPPPTTAASPEEKAAAFGELSTNEWQRKSPYDTALDQLHTQLQKEIEANGGTLPHDRAVFYAAESAALEAEHDSAGKNRKGPALKRAIARHRAAQAGPDAAGPETPAADRPAAPGPGPAEAAAGRAAEPRVAGREAEPATPGQPVGSVGAATALPPTPTPPPGTPGAEAPIPPPPERPAKSAVAWFRSAKDFISSLAQKSYPALTRLSARAGELLGETSNAKAAAKAVWAYMGQQIQVKGGPLAKLSLDAQRELGATWLEMRMRHERERLDQEHRDLLAKAGSTGKPEDYQAALDARLARDEVRTLIGTKGSPLKDEAMFDGNVAGLFSFFDQIRQHWTPEVDRNYEGITGRDPNDPNSVQSQIPGLPLNAIALDPNAPGAVSTGGGKAQSLANLKIRKPGMTRHASLSAEAYDVNLHTMMQRTLMDGISAARKAEFVRQSIKDGVIQAVKGADAPNKGWEYLALDPARGLKGLDPEARYYVDPVAAKDVEQGLGIGRRPGQLLAGGIKPVMDVAYNIALLAPVELATHVGNQFTALFRPGMGNPLFALGRSAREMIRLVQKDPESLRKVAELTKMSAAFGHEAKPGWGQSLVGLGEYLPGANAEKVQALAERVGKYDPTTYFNRLTGGAIDIMQKAVRIQLSEAYDRVVAAGEFKDTPGGKRDFINQAVGNYNAQAGNRVAQLLRDSGLQSFATAAHTFTAQGVKSLWGGAINARTTGPRAELMLRSRAVLKLLPVMALGPVINSLVWGQAFPQGVPVFAIKTRDDEEGTRYFDQLAFTGLRRGAKATFVNATVEGMRKGETGGQIVDRGLSDLGLSAAHAVAGPPVQTAYTAATGKDMMGRTVAEQVSKATTNEGVRQAAREGKPLPGESQRYYDAKAALVGLNPVSKILSEREAAKQPKSWWQAVMQSAGPFGEKTKAPPPAKKK